MSTGPTIPRSECVVTQHRATHSDWECAACLKHIPKGTKYGHLLVRVLPDADEAPPEDQVVYLCQWCVATINRVVMKTDL